MNKITLAQLKEQQQISSLDEYENMDLHHAELDYSSHNFYVDNQGREANYPKFYRNAQKVLAKEQGEKL